jgi:hypothetical protein
MEFRVSKLPLFHCQCAKLISEGLMIWTNAFDQKGDSGNTELLFLTVSGVPKVQINKSQDINSKINKYHRKVHNSEGSRELALVVIVKVERLNQIRQTHG